MHGHHEERISKWWLLPIFIAVWGLGSWGFTQAESGSVFDAVYRGLQLFPLHSGDVTHVPWQLQVARFAAPVVVGLATLAAIVLLLREGTRQFRFRFVSRHTVIAGNSPEVVHLAESFTSEGAVAVIGVESAPVVAERLNDLGTYVLRGAALSRDTLDRARISRAKSFIAVQDSDAGALAAGRAAAAAGQSELQIFVRVNEPRLWRRLAGQWLEPPSSGARIDVFNPVDTAARLLLSEYPVRARAGIVIVGVNELGRSILLHAARDWHREAYGRDDEDVGDPLRAVLVGAGANAAIERMRIENRALERLCSTTVFDAAPYAIALDDHRSLAELVDDALVVLCAEDEDDAISISLALDELWRGAVVVVCTPSGEDEVRRALVDVQGVSERRVFGVAEQVYTTKLVRNGVRELLARYTHEDFLAHARERGEGPPEHPAAVPWEQLSATYKESSRAQVDDLTRKLAKIGYRHVPVALPDPARAPIQLSMDAVDKWAREEHDRYVSERTAAGWKYGPTRDEVLRTNPTLVAWDDLPDEEKQKDTDTWQDLPRRLQLAGFELELVADEVLELAVHGDSRPNVE